MADKVIRRYHGKEERTVDEARQVGLSHPQRRILKLASNEIWATARELGTSKACCNALVKRDLLVTRLIGDNLCYRLK